MKNTYRYTLASLLTAYRVEIPVIQRDFAQGRETNEKIGQIRKSFAAALVNALKEDKPLHLDFIYGKVTKDRSRELMLRNRAYIDDLLKAVQHYSNRLDVLISYELPDDSSIESSSDYFIPLDGQQRMTTLYLLYWYISYRGGLAPRLLERFSYKTRGSSAGFCKLLVGHIEKLDKNVVSSVSELIKDQHFVFDEWLLDPTVSGMLVMLQEIHELLKETNEEQIKVYYHRLYDAGRNVISFDFLDLDRIKTEDELYVTMNSRGKQLTDFENFKSWLIGYTAGQGMELMADWDRKMDLDWMDILWKHRNRKKIDDLDQAYLNVFKRAGQYCYIISRQKRPDLSPETRAIVEKLDKQEEYLPFSFYEENAIFNDSSLGFLFSFLDLLKDGGSDELDRLMAEYTGDIFFEGTFSTAFFRGDRQLNLFDKTFLYAVILFVSNLGKQVRECQERDKQLFAQWIRVTRNLIYNSRIDDTPEFISAINSLYFLGDHCLDIIKHLASDPNILYFSSRQRLDEVAKAKLIQENAAWIEDFSVCENHPYFYGQVLFLLQLAGGSNRAAFREYGKRARELFSNENLDSPDFKLQRTFLSKGDYLVDKGAFRKSFCLSNRASARSRDENWRSVFNDPAPGRGLAILKSLLDGGETPDEVIAKEIVGLSDWRKYFVRYPELLGLCKQGMIRIEAGERPESCYFLLLGQSKICHYHCELYSYLLYLMLDREQNRDDLKLKYKAQKGGDDLPWLEIMVGEALIQISFDGMAGVYRVWLEGESEDLKDQLLGMGYAEAEDCLEKAADENIIFDDMKSIIGQ